jgi:succinoglycan biosynthesis protein ExoA
MLSPCADLPFISVIVPARNEAFFIRKTVEGLICQDYPKERFEVLVIDGESADATPEIVQELQRTSNNLKLFVNPKRVSSAARNIGVRNADGEYLVVVDGHCEVKNPDYLRNVASGFERSKADCLGRPQPLDVAGATPVQKAIAAARSSWLGHHPASYIYSDQEQFVRPQSVAVAYRRSVFEKVGLFDESFDACEDVEFNHRVDEAGLRCFLAPAIAVRYYPRSTLRGLFHQMARYGRGRMRLLRKHPESASLPSIMPALFVIGLPVGLLGAWVSDLLAMAFWGVIGFYLLLVVSCSFLLAWPLKNARAGVLLPGVFFAIHLGTGIGFLQELVLGRRQLQVH